jgi:hypothetical protein
MCKKAMISNPKAKTVPHPPQSHRDQEGSPPEEKIELYRA